MIPSRAVLMAAVFWLAATSGCSRRQAEGEFPPAPRVVRSFPAAGVKMVVLRASEVDAAVVTTDPTATAVEVSGQPVGGAKGYHSPEPNWKETPPGEWGLDFVAEAFGSVLVVSSKSEIHYIHHHYALHDLRVRVPPGVEVVRQRRELTGDGTPDLKKLEP